MHLFNFFNGNDHLTAILRYLYTNLRYFLNGVDFKNSKNHLHTVKPFLISLEIS